MTIMITAKTPETARNQIAQWLEWHSKVEAGKIHTTHLQGEKNRYEAKSEICLELAKQLREIPVME